MPVINNKHAVKAMRDLAIKLQSREGVDDITHNDVTGDYLKQLVLK